MDLHFEDSNNKSLKRFERMLKTDSIYFFDSAEFEKIIAYYIDNGKISLAKKALDLASDQHPGTVEISVLRAEIYILENKLSEAEALLDDLSSLDSENEEIYIQKAHLLSKQDHHKEAIDYLKVALDMTQEEFHIDIINMLGMEYLFLEEFQKASGYFKQCLALDSKDQTALNNVVYCYDMADLHEKSINFLNEYIELEPFCETAWYLLGKEYYILESFDKAIKAFDYALLIDDKFIGGYLEKAKTLERLKQYKDAIYIYHLTLKMDDPTAYAYTRIGKCYEVLGENDKAIDNYVKANNEDPYLESPIIELVKLYNKKQQYQRSLFFVNQLINLDDENPDFWKLYGDVNFKIAFFEEAAKSYERCLKFKKKSSDLYLKLADSYYFIGDYRRAIKILIDADFLYHGDQNINIRLSGLHFLTNSQDLGGKYFDRFIKRDAKLYRTFQKLFPALHNSQMIRDLLEKHNLL